MAVNHPVYYCQKFKYSKTIQSNVDAICNDTELATGDKLYGCLQ